MTNVDPSFADAAFAVVSRNCAAGNYSLAFTCEADLDDALNDDDIDFIATSNATVSINTATESNIQ